MGAVSGYLRRAGGNMPVPYSDDWFKMLAHGCASVIDYNGVEHEGVLVHYVSKDLWDKHRAAGFPEMIDTIYAKDIKGPGLYYLAGSTYADGLDVWMPVAVACWRHGERIGSPEHIVELDDLYEIDWVIQEKRRDGADSVSRYMDSCKRGILLSTLQSGTVVVPDCSDGCLLRLRYRVHGTTHYIDLVNKWSDKVDEQYTNPLDGELVLAAIREDRDDYTYNYHAYRRKAEAEGRNISVPEFLVNYMYIDRMHKPAGRL